MPIRFLYLVRHGEADDEGGLTEAGRQQAGAAGERLRNVRFSVIRHSPEQRAEETADLIADCLPGVPIGPSGLLGDYLPPVPEQAELPPVTPRWSSRIPPRSEPKARNWPGPPSGGMRGRPTGTAAS